MTTPPAQKHGGPFACLGMLMLLVTAIEAARHLWVALVPAFALTTAWIVFLATDGDTWRDFAAQWRQMYLSEHCATGVHGDPKTPMNSTDSRENAKETPRTPAPDPGTLVDRLRALRELVKQWRAEVNECDPFNGEHPHTATARGMLRVCANELEAVLAAPAWANTDAPGICKRGHTERRPKCPACHEMRIAVYEAVVRRQPPSLSRRRRDA